MKEKKKMADRKVFKLDDSVIAGIARALQQALLLGVDVVDFFRMMKFQPKKTDPNTLEFTQEYLDYEEGTLQSLLDEAEQLQSVDNGNLDLGDEDSLYDEVQDDEVLYVNDKPLFGSGDKHGPN